MTFVQLNRRPVNGNFNNLMSDLFVPFPSLFKGESANSSFKQFVAVNVKEKADGYILELMAPGFEKEDFKINYDEKLLTISTERKNETDDNKEKFIRREFIPQPFKRTFTVDDQIETENIEARYINGVLTLNLPKKKEVKASVKQIEIQ